jgi:hypothetical protein
VAITPNKEIYMIEELNLKKYKRFFAFGCSFTNYHYATWADILGKDIPEYYNYGISGTGNQCIFHSLIEAHTRHNIGKDDLVIIMWTNISREDRWVNGSWLNIGTIYNQSYYDNNFMQKCVSNNGYLIRDLSYINAADLLLTSFECDYDFLSMIPIVDPDQYSDHMIYEDVTKYQETIELYKNVINKIKPSVQTLLYPNKIWQRYEMIKIQDNPNKKWYYDLHPITITYLKYLQATYKNYEPSESTKQFIEEHMKVITNMVFDRSTYVVNNKIKRL